MPITKQPITRVNNANDAQGFKLQSMPSNVRSDKPVKASDTPIKTKKNYT